MSCLAFSSSQNIFMVFCSIAALNGPGSPVSWMEDLAVHTADCQTVLRIFFFFAFCVHIQTSLATVIFDNKPTNQCNVLVKSKRPFMVIGGSNSIQKLTNAANTQSWYSYCLATGVRSQCVMIGKASVAGQLL